MQPTSGQQRVLTPGRPVRLWYEPLRVLRVDIQAFSGNTGDVHIGSENINADGKYANGQKVPKGQILTLERVDLYDVWMDAGTADDGVSMSWELDDDR